RRRHLGPGLPRRHRRAGRRGARARAARGALDRQRAARHGANAGLRSGWHGLGPPGPAARAARATRRRAASAPPGRELNMSAARILVIDGNRAAIREQQIAAGGSATGEGYVGVLAGLAPVSCDIVRPADGAVRLARALADYDGVAINGYEGGPAVERQLALAAEVFAAGVPFFGSCWGMQVAVTAAGGRVRRNP